MAQSKEFVDASHALNTLSHALAMLESENSSLRGAVEGFASENAELKELVRSFHSAMLCTLETDLWPTDPKWLEQRMRELGMEVD